MLGDGRRQYGQGGAHQPAKSVSQFQCQRHQLRLAALGTRSRVAPRAASPQRRILVAATLLRRVQAAVMSQERTSARTPFEPSIANWEDPDANVVDCRASARRTADNWRPGARARAGARGPLLRHWRLSL